MIEAIPKFRTGPALEQTSREHGLPVTRTCGDRDDADARFEPALELRALKPCGKRRRRCELQPMDEHTQIFCYGAAHSPNQPASDSVRGNRESLESCLGRRGLCMR